METRATKRIHIGNVSRELAENGSRLADRILKFGELTRPLLFHTKPINDYYFAFADMNISSKEYERLRAALHGITYMGRKLTVAKARPRFDEAWRKDHGRPETPRTVAAQHEAIAQARALRISEASAAYPVNAVFGTPLAKTAAIAGSAMGYLISAHTLHNLSGNTKNDAPSLSFMGSKSYGSTLVPVGPYTQLFSRNSGFGAVIKGRHRHTVRPAAHFARKEQSLRILVNGKLKRYKFHKTKLWGLEKNRSARDLTCVYEDGVWKSADGHAVERVAKRVCMARPSAGQSATAGEESCHDGESAATERKLDHAASADDEQSKNKTVLAKLFSSFDFDKKVSLNDELDEETVVYDSNGRKTMQRFDFEIQGAVLDESDGEAPTNGAMELVESYARSHELPSDFQYYSEDDEGNEVDFDALAQGSVSDSTEVPPDGRGSVLQVDDKVKELDETSTADSEDSGEKHLLPSFGPPPTTSTTEDLRSLFSKSSDKSRLNLQLETDDFDEEQLKEAEKERKALQKQLAVKKKEHQEKVQIVQLRKSHGLFWMHSDSPFLQQQTQLARLGNPDERIVLPGESADHMSVQKSDEDDYEKWFWSVRGEYSRECNRRMTDVNRRKSLKRMTFP
ncbi:hypothetical protein METBISCDRAFT_17240 [Metschnikowia bicuspidata]|uniref:Uncharacterized protein n=1 Tax=Metschnikowia bicuspidata TaxID=27322 RepID=A0A4P9ZBH9_9ASCO|nr:hypothetical protein METBISCDRAFT_17240 [Metschnikowia bicuspidata]